MSYGVHQYVQYPPREQADNIIFNVLREAVAAVMEGQNPCFKKTHQILRGQKDIPLRIVVGITAAHDSDLYL